MANSGAAGRPWIGRPLASFSLAVGIAAIVLGPALVNPRLETPRVVAPIRLSPTATLPTPTPTPTYLDGSLDFADVTASTLTSRNPSYPSEVVIQLVVTDTAPVHHLHKLFFQLIDSDGHPLAAVTSITGVWGNGTCLVSGDKTTFECDPPPDSRPALYDLYFALADLVGNERQSVQPSATSNNMEAAPWKGQFYSCSTHDCVVGG